MVCNVDDGASWLRVFGTSYGPLKGQAKANCAARVNMLGSYTLDSGTVDVQLIPDVFKAEFGKQGVNFTVSPGCDIDQDRLDLIPAAVAAARKADVAVVAVGDSMASCGEWQDRDSLDLPGGQLALLEALLNQTSTPVVVVLINGRAASFGPGNTLLSKVAAVVEAWRPGEMGAQAIVDILSGKVNPSGKLANQWAQHVGQLGSGAQPFLARRVAKWLANGRSAADPTDGRMYDPYTHSQYSSLPLFRFGFGLSYTTFEYKRMNITVAAGGVVANLPGRGVYSGRGKAGYVDAFKTTVMTADVTVCNTGLVDGAEVVQIYSQDPRAAFAVPIVPYWKRLVG